MAEQDKRPLNTMDAGMWPMNYGVRLVKEAGDVLFSLGLDDRGSAEARLDALERTVRELRASMAKLQGPH